VAGWAAFGLAAAVAVRTWHAAAVRGQAVARACHEVRGPLAAARLGLESGSEAPASTRLRAIEVELARASVALDDLQAVERIELSGPGPERVNVRAWVEDSVEAWRPVARVRGMEIWLEWIGPDPEVWGRQSRLAQVTGNLIANAIAHGEKVVVVRGRVAEDAVMVEVQDGGPGLPPPVSAWLMAPSGRGPGGREWGRSRPNGHGHGLRIARAVIESHGGRLTVGGGQQGVGPAGGEAAQGARIVVTLPLARA
jgi:signal transduction histidine kinase